MSAVLLLGFLMGIRHALEADHLAAVATLVTRSSSLRAGVLHGAMWGLGHTLVLLVVGGGCLLLGLTIPERMAQAVELAVGAMLVALGAEVLWRVCRQRVHVHVHRHATGASHLHAHSHAPHEHHDPEHHEHPHPAGVPRRALLVGMVHGLAGSAALLLLTLQTIGAPWLGLAHAGLFGAGSILGMAALSAVVAVPLKLSARLLTRVHNGLEALVGLAALGVGGLVLYRVAAAGGLPV